MRGHCGVPHNSPRAFHPSRLLPYKHQSPVSPLECALPRCCVNAHSKQLTRSAKLFRMRTYKKTGGRGPLLYPPSRPPFTPKPTWSYHQTGILPRLKSFVSHSYENCRVYPLSSHFGSRASGRTRPFFVAPPPFQPPNLAFHESPACSEPGGVTNHQSPSLHYGGLP
jgi:hypothetical protein